MATKKQRGDVPQKVRVADDKKVKVALEKVRNRDRELLKRLAR